jgi:nicotinamide-nucleotide amidase
MAQTQSSRPCRAHLINIGDELLEGVRPNGHLIWLGEQLARRGIRLTQASIVRDELDAIADEVRQAWSRCDLVITTGGMGPTTDDLARDAVARALALPMEPDPAAERALRERFAKIGREVGELDLRQCRLPRGAVSLPNPRGTSPGLFLRVGERSLAMLPGPGIELRPLFEKEVVPRLRDVGSACDGEAYVQVRTFGLGAAPLESLIRPLLRPGMQLTFGTHSGVVDARISPGSSGACCDAMMDVARAVRDAVGDDFVCTGHSSLAQLAVERLGRLGRTLAVAESCTGGLLASHLTDIPGASRVLVGSLVAYTNDAKVGVLGVPQALIDQHGAVSAEVAAAMATAATERFGAHHGLAITGFAGPEGGTAADPVGTVYLGYSSPSGVWSRRIVVAGDRAQVKIRAVNTALDWLRRKLSRFAVEDAIHGA